MRCTHKWNEQGLEHEFLGSEMDVKQQINLFVNTSLMNIYWWGEFPF